jgi:magnesium chelatase family protein
MHINLPPVSLNEMRTRRSGEPSKDVRMRVNKARGIQLMRYNNEKGIFYNAEMKISHVDRYCKLNKTSRDIFDAAINRLGLSARAYDKVLKIARTIADLDSRGDIMPQDVSEAIGYRTLDRGVL